MTDLKKNIIEIEPREKSGGPAQNRFDFQKNWAICKILELHEKPDDYLASLEYHDDIIVFDSSTNPNKVSFYQIKTKEKSKWTINELIRRKKGKDGKLLNSPLGKLYEHIEKFDNSVESLNFITNNQIKGNLISGKKCEETIGFCCNDLEKSELNKIINSIKEEYALDVLKDFSQITYFKLGELSIDKHSELTKIRLADYIEKSLPNVRYQISPLYKSIFDEIRIKSNFEKDITSFEELKKYKSISRKDFQEYLDVLKVGNSIKETGKSIENRLNSENASFLFIKNFRENSKIYEIKKMKYNDKALINAEKEINIIIKNTAHKTSLLENTEQVFKSLNLKKLTNNDITEDLIKTIILYKLYE